MNIEQKTREELLPLLEAAIRDHLNKFDGFFSKEMVEYHLSTGGKRIRGLLPLITYQAEGRNPLDALPIGVCAELLHNATLIHDDIQDGDEIRRGKDTVWKKFGNAQAINAGNALFHIALDSLNDLQVQAPVKLAIQKLALDCVLKVIEGQAQEFLMKEESFPNTQRYLSVAEGKTSGLFIFPLCASLIALGETNRLEIAKQNMVAQGLIFQIEDDLLDLYGDKGRGATCNDLREGKISYLCAHVFETGTEDQKQALHSILKANRDSTDSNKINEALQIFENTSAFEHSKQFIETLKKGLTHA